MVPISHPGHAHIKRSSYGSPSKKPTKEAKRIACYHSSAPSWLHQLSLRYIISQKQFRTGGVAVSEGTRSVRAVRDSPVAYYSAPGANMMRRVAYHPPITVSPFLFAVWVFYWKRILRYGRQLWPYVWMGSLGTSAKCKSVWKPHTGFHQHKAFRLSYSSLLQWQDSVPHNMACIIKVSLHIYIRSIWPQMLVEHNRRSTCGRPMPGKKVRRNDSIQPWESTQLRGSTTSRKERVKLKVGEDRVCIFVGW